MAGGQNAQCSIWVSPNWSEKHLAAVQWLGALTSEEIQVYSVEVSVLRIDYSDPAAELRVVASPKARQGRLIWQTWYIFPGCLANASRPSIGSMTFVGCVPI